MNNLDDSVVDGQKVVVSVRPEEFSISDNGLKCKISNSTFLGKYTNYVLDFADGMCLENQPSIEFSQDLGHSEHIYRSGDSISLEPNPTKINVFTEDMARSLIKEVKRFA